MKKTSKPRRTSRRMQSPKKCYFCTEKKSPTYKDVEVLTRFLTERGKIVGRVRNGLCAQHQRDVTTAIKHARHLALLSFVGH